MVVLGSRGSAQRMRCESEAYCGFVGIGSYLVMEEKHEFTFNSGGFPRRVR